MAQKVAPPPVSKRPQRLSGGSDSAHRFSVPSQSSRVFSSATKVKQKHHSHAHTSQPLTLAPTSLSPPPPPPPPLAANASSPRNNFARAAGQVTDPRLGDRGDNLAADATADGELLRVGAIRVKIRPHLAWPWESFSCSDCRLFLPPVQLLSQGCLPPCTTPAAPLPAR